MGINISANGLLCPNEIRDSGYPAEIKFTENNDAAWDSEIAIEIPVTWNNESMLKNIEPGEKLTITLDKDDIKRIAIFLGIH